MQFEIEIYRLRFKTEKKHWKFIGNNFNIKKDMKNRFCYNKSWVHRQKCFWLEFVMKFWGRFLLILVIFHSYFRIDFQKMIMKLSKWGTFDVWKVKGKIKHTHFNHLKNSHFLEYPKVKKKSYSVSFSLQNFPEIPKSAFFYWWFLNNSN